MKIVHVISGLGRGGAERALFRLIKEHQGRNEFKHEVISLTTKGYHGSTLESIGVEVHSLRMNRPLVIPYALAKLIILLRRAQPDVVQTWMYHADLFGGLAARLTCRAPVLWGIHSFNLKRGGSPVTRFFQALCSKLSRLVPTKIICVAESSKKLHIALGYDKSKFEVIPNGFDVDNAPISPEHVKAFRSAIGLDSEAMLIGCVGRFNPAKDHYNFIKACSLVASTVPYARFLMVGLGLDSDNKILRDWLDDTGISNRFVLLGERDDIPLVLSSMDVFCSSSRTEAFPLVVGEAMVMARPCVVTDVGDTAFLVGDTALVVPPENSEELAKALLHILSLPEVDRSELGLRGRSRVINNFSIEKHIRHLESVYNEILNINSR